MSKLKRNFIYQSLYEILIIILPLVTSPYIARVLGAESLGIYSYTYTISNYFVLFALLGIKNYGNRTIASVREDKNLLNKTFSSIFVLHALVSVLVLALYIIYIIWGPKDLKIYSVIQIFWIFGALFDISWLFFGLEEFKLTVARNTIIKIINVILIFCFVKKTSDLWKYTLIMSGCNLISQLVIWPFVKKYVTFKFVDLKTIKPHIKPMLILFIPVLAISLYKQMDKIMLGVMSTKTQVGLYENAEKAISIPVSIITAFGTIMLPKMSNLIANGNLSQGKKYINVSMEFVMCLATAMCFGLAGIANQFSVLFWGEEFSDCGILIQILSLCTLFLSFANVIRTQYLMPYKMDKVYIISVSLGAIINVIVNFFMIPKYFAVGAAIGTVLAECTVCIIQTIAAKKDLPIFFYIKNTIFFSVFGSIMFLLVKKIGSTFEQKISTLLLQILVGGILYSLLCFGYFYIKKNEVLMRYLHKK